MGVIQVPGERSGQLYSIQIDGDVPTNTEYARIADYIKQQEDAFAQRYEQSFGEDICRAPAGALQISLDKN